MNIYNNIAVHIVAECEFRDIDDAPFGLLSLVPFVDPPFGAFRLSEALRCAESWSNSTNA